MVENDTVAAKSAFLCLYMKNHPVTVASFVMHELWLQDQPYATVREASLDQINRDGMRITYRPAAGKSKRLISIPFDPPLAGYEEVRPRLIAMKQDSEEALGLVRHPPMDRFVGPHPFYAMMLLPWIALLVFVSLPDNNHPIAHRVREHSFGWNGVYAAWATFLVLHTGEAWYASTLCRRTTMGYVNEVLWVASTFVFGFASLTQLRALICEASLSSVTKEIKQQ